MNNKKYNLFNSYLIKNKVLKIKMILTMNNLTIQHYTIKKKRKMRILAKLLLLFKNKENSIILKKINT